MLDGQQDSCAILRLGNGLESPVDRFPLVVIKGSLPQRAFFVGLVFEDECFVCPGEQGPYKR